MVDAELDRLYDTYRDIEITFNDEVAGTTGLVQRSMLLKYGDESKPCRLHSASLSRAKVLARLSPEELEKLKMLGSAFLRYSFTELRSEQVPVSFLVPYELAGFNPVIQIGSASYLITLESATRPPDDLIRCLGEFVEANANAAHRREERIKIDRSSMELIGLKSSTTHIRSAGVEMKCILLDLSLRGAKVLISAKHPPDKNALTLRLIVTDPDEIMEIPAAIMRSNPAGAKKDTLILGLHYEDEKVPLGYKVRFNRCLSKRSAAHGGDPEPAGSAGPDRMGGDTRAPEDGERREMMEKINGMLASLKSQRIWPPDADNVREAISILEALKNSLDR